MVGWYGMGGLAQPSRLFLFGFAGSRVEFRTDWDSTDSLNFSTVYREKEVSRLYTACR
jgi:hypothetical protein